MIEVSRLKDLNAAKLFLGFCIGAISRRDFAVFPVQGQRGLRRPKRYFGDKMSVGAQMVVVLKAFVERSVSLVLAHPFEFSWLDVSQSLFFSSWREPAQPCPLIVHPIVVAHRKNRQPRRIVFRAGETEQFGCFRRQEPSQGRLPGKAAIRPSDEKQVSTKPPPPPLAGVSEIACLCFTLSCSRMTIIKASASYFACVSPATTAASLSSIWFQPSN